MLYFSCTFVYIYVVRKFVVSDLFSLTALILFFFSIDINVSILHSVNTAKYLPTYSCL